MRRDLHTHTQHKRDRLDQSQTAAVLYSTHITAESQRGEMYINPIYVCVSAVKRHLLYYSIYLKSVPGLYIYISFDCNNINRILFSSYYRLMLWLLPGRSLTRRLANEPQLRIQNGQYQEDQDSH
jgi:hypothetical protein